MSSTAICTKDAILFGIIGAENIVKRFCEEAKYVSGMEVTGIFEQADRMDFANELAQKNELFLYTDLVKW